MSRESTETVTSKHLDGIINYQENCQRTYLKAFIDSFQSIDLEKMKGRARVNIKTRKP